MLSLSMTLEQEACDCDFLLNDDTGFNTSNPGGFLPEGSSPFLNDYRLSDGYFVNTISRYNLDSSLTLLYVSEPFHIRSGEVDTDYSINFPTLVLKDVPDGKLLFKRVFIISKDFYEAGSHDPSKTVIYYDVEQGVYQILEDGEVKHICLSEFIYSFDENYVGGYSEVILFSSCNLKKCYSKLTLDYLDDLSNNPRKNMCITDCNERGEKNNLKYKSDFVLAAHKSIEYLLQCGLEYDAMRLLLSIEDCGGFCKNIKNNNLNNYNCGCT